jgi:hypothetical protein
MSSRSLENKNEEPREERRGEELVINYGRN